MLPEKLLNSVLNKKIRVVYHVILSLERVLCLIYLQTNQRATHQQTGHILQVSKSRKKDINNKEGCRGREGPKA